MHCRAPENIETTESYWTVKANSVQSKIVMHWIYVTYKAPISPTKLLGQRSNCNHAYSICKDESKVHTSLERQEVSILNIYTSYIKYTVSTLSTESPLTSQTSAKHETLRRLSLRMLDQIITKEKQKYITCGNRATNPQTGITCSGRQTDQNT